MKNRFYNDMVKAGYFDPESGKYIWIREMEWIKEDGENDFIPEIPEGVVPFAITGGGDVWAADGDSGEIFLYYHDDDEPEFIADSLENAVFRQLVEYLSDNDFTESDDKDDENSTAYAREYIKMCCDVFKPYFLKEQTEILSEFAERPISEYKSGKYVYHSFLDFDGEAQDIIDRFVGECDESEEDEDE